LITAKNRISVPSSPAVIADETGSGMSTAAIRTTIQASMMITSSPRITPQNPCQPLRETLPNGSGRSTLCQARNMSMKSSTPAASMICAPRESAESLSIWAVLS
jgi:hypothetical protein